MKPWTSLHDIPSLSLPLPDPVNRQSTIHELAAEFGFYLHRTGKHLVWHHPNGSRIVTAITPSDHRALLNIRARMRRLTAAS